MSIAGEASNDRAQAVAGVVVASARPRARGLATTVVALATCVGLSLADGGFFAREWGAALLLLGAVLAGATLVQRTPLVPRRAATLGVVLAGFVGWVALSLAWSRSTSLTVADVHRDLVLLAVVAVAVVVAGRAHGGWIVAGVGAAATGVACGGLVEYLVTRGRPPAPFQGVLLHEPLGYANGMGILSVVGILIAMVGAREEPPLVRMPAVASLVTLGGALAATGSRASVLALGVGVAALLALDGRRDARRPGVAVLLAAALAGFAVVELLGLRDTTLDPAVAGRRGTVALVVLAALTAVAVLVASRSRGPARPPRVPTTWAVVAAIVAAAVALAALAITQPSLGSDRPEYWRVALDAYAERPFLGTGAGTFHLEWLERRPIPASVRDAHGLPVEALSELGPIGLAFVLTIIVLPLSWAWRARGARGAGAGAAFAALAVHGAVDWDWELPAVAAPMLLLGVALAASADAAKGAAPLLVRRRRAVAIGGAAIALLGLGLFVGERELDRARAALAREDWATAESHARLSSRLEPWSVEPLLVRGQALLAAGRRGEARRMYVSAIGREPDDGRAWLGLAVATDGGASALALARARQLNPLALRAGGHDEAGSEARR